MQPPACLNATDIGTLTATFLFAINGPLLTVVMLLGVVTNAVNLRVFCTQNHSYYKGLRPYLISLASWDLFLVVSCWTLFSFPSLFYTNGIVPLHGVLTQLYFYMNPICNMAYTGCTLTNVLASVERYLALCHPMWHKTLMVRTRVQVALAVIALLAVTVNAPRFFEFDVSACVDAKGRSHSQLNLRLAASSLYVKLYTLPMGIVLLSVGPMVIMTFTTNRIMMVMREFVTSDSEGHCESPMRPRRHSTSSVMLQRILSRMLVIVTIKFMVCNMLPSVLDVCQAIYVDSILHFGFYHVMVDLSNALVMLQSATNFFVYYVYQAKFRRSCKRLLSLKPPSCRAVRIMTIPL